MSLDLHYLSSIRHLPLRYTLFPYTTLFRSSEIKDGYVTVTRAWSTGDIVEIELPMGLYTYTAKDDAKKQVIMYGPIVLAGALGTENFPETDILADHMKLDHQPLIEVPTLGTDDADVNKWVKPIEG